MSLLRLSATREMRLALAGFAWGVDSVEQALYGTRARHRRTLARPPEDLRAAPLYADVTVETVEPAHGRLRPGPRRRLRRRPSCLVTPGHAPGADPAGFKLRGFAGRVAGRRRPRGGPPTAPPGAVVRARAGQWQIGRRRWTRAAGTGAAWVARGRRATRAWFDPRHRSTGAGHHDMGLQRSTSPSAPPRPTSTPARVEVAARLAGGRVKVLLRGQCAQAQAALLP